MIFFFFYSLLSILHGILQWGNLHFPSKRRRLLLWRNFHLASSRKPHLIHLERPYTQAAKEIQRHPYIWNSLKKKHACHRRQWMGDSCQRAKDLGGSKRRGIFLQQKWERSDCRQNCPGTLLVTLGVLTHIQFLHLVVSECLVFAVWCGR